MTDSLQTFFALWSEGNTDQRAERLSGVMAAPFQYCDPKAPTVIDDLDALNAYIGMFSHYAPGATATVVRSSETQGHHRVTVAFRMSDGSEQLGQYFVELDADGRLARLIGFAGLGEPE